MSTRTFERLLLASSLALGAGVFAGCSDGGSSSTADAGGDAGKDSSIVDRDSGADTGDEDAGDVEAPPTLVSDDGTVTCAPVPLTSKDTWADACWADDAHTICGVDANKLPGGDPTATTPNCIAQDAPGKLSTYCGAFFDQTDAVVRETDPDDPTKTRIVRDANGKPTFETKYVDGALTVVAGGGIVLRFDGCCLPSGECGAILSTPRPLDAAGKIKVPAFDGTDFNLHLGCTSVPDLLARLADPNAEAVDSSTLAHLPFCDYSQDDPAAPTSGFIAGVPAFVCGCGEDKVYTGEGIPCLNNLNEAVCGKDAPSDEQLASIPAFVCGAPAQGTSVLPTLPNVDSTVCGKKAVTEDSEELAQIPAFICGEEGAKPRTLLPLLRNVSNDICGKLPTSTKDLENIPQFFCGCIDTPVADFECIRGSLSDVCGTFPATPFLPIVPKYLCGCGAETRDDGIGPLCLSNVATSACGTAPDAVDTKGTDVTTDDCLVGVPEYAAGCGTGVETPTGGSCLRDTPARFGCDNVAESQPRLPEFLCGCGDGVAGASEQAVGRDANGLACLPNVAVAYCGRINVPSSAALAAIAPTLPNGICGCGETTSSQAACLDNVGLGICGPVPYCSPVGQNGGCGGGNICRDIAGGVADGIGDSCVAPTL